MEVNLLDLGVYLLIWIGLALISQRREGLQSVLPAFFFIVFTIIYVIIFAIIDIDVIDIVRNIGSYLGEIRFTL